MFFFFGTDNVVKHVRERCRISSSRQGKILCIQNLGYMFRENKNTKKHHKTYYYNAWNIFCFVVFHFCAAGKKMKNDKTKNASSAKHYFFIFVFPIWYVNFISAYPRRYPAPLPMYESFDLQALPCQSLPSQYISPSSRYYTGHHSNIIW